MAERVDLDAVMDLGMQPFTGWTVAQWRTWQDMVPAMVAELRVAREVIKDIRSALAPGRWRGFDGPDGVSKDEVIVDVAAALMRYDRHARPSTPDRSESPP